MLVRGPTGCLMKGVLLGFVVVLIMIIWWFCCGNWRNTFGSTGRGRFLSTESNKIDEPLKVEEAETVQTPPPAVEKVLSGYVCVEFFSFEIMFI